jgi:hypothetical protein
MVEIMTLWSPHKLLKNLGALSEYAKCSQSSPKIKKMKSLPVLSILDTMDGQRKPSHATVPLNGSVMVNDENVLKSEGAAFLPSTLSGSLRVAGAR